MHLPVAFYLLFVLKSGSNLFTEGFIPPNTLLFRRCKNFIFRTKLLWNLAPLSECMNYLIKTVDLELHDKMVELRDKMVRDSMHVEAICAISPSLYCTMGVIVNQISGSHRDYNNTKGVWVMMFLLGNFKGSEVVFSMPGDKEVTTRFQSGDTILIKVWDVVHEIKNYESDLRVTFVYFTLSGLNMIWVNTLYSSEQNSILLYEKLLLD